MNQLDSNNINLEKEIKELAELICIDCTEYGDCEWGKGRCECVLREARMIINAGYRKVNAVFKPKYTR